MSKRGVRWAKRNPIKKARYNQRWYYKRKYGLSVAEQEALFAQGIRCGLCGIDKPGSIKGWHLDHSHTTGVVRGVLCYRCNVGGGMFNDDPGLLQKAVRWFSKS